MTSRARRGFTLVELMVVIAIIGLLSTVVTVGVMAQLKKARVQKALADMQRLKDAIRLFRIDLARAPRQLDELWQAPADAGRRWGGPYLDEPLPPDPWGGAYHYAVGPGGGVELVCYGADGAPGGEDEAADLRPGDATGP